MNRYLCIHGHFYQPPRENPWLEEVESQDSAYPYHDWNERITAECYAPNTAARILDSGRRIIDIINNYSRISFNFGPTLFSWMERTHPEVYRAVLEADRESMKRFSGHGSALAQAYSHLIMPLANRRDQRTQVIWGIRDFQSRFQRFPEGMWLPETAVDLPTLETLAAEGIRFTILAPHQAGRVRQIGKGRWSDVRGGRIDPKIPYLCRLPSGGQIVIFFYDGPPSQEVSFSNLLNNGENFAHRLAGTFDSRQTPQLAHIATDGETYGHHRRHGDMALAYCLYHIENNQLARLTIYGEYLEKHPPAREVEIIENTSWSCAHGVERWRGNCGCCSGQNPGWSQSWRPFLREAMDWLRDNLASVFEQGMAGLVTDPWAARNEYISVILDRSDRSLDQYFSRTAGRRLAADEKVRALRLLEMQRHGLGMYTSCGWFFDEISGIETVQVMKYAARAIQLARESGGEDLEAGYLDRLARAPSNIPYYENGAGIYRKLIEGTRIDLLRVAAHYAVSSLFEDYPDRVRIFSFSARREEGKALREGKRNLISGKVTVKSLTTHRKESFDYAVLYPGNGNVIGRVCPARSLQDLRTTQAELEQAFAGYDLARIIRIMDGYFGQTNYSFWHLFADEQRRILERILDGTVGELEGALRKIKEQYQPTINVVKNLGIPLPHILGATVELTLNSDLRKELKADVLNQDRISKLAGQFQEYNIKPDRPALNYLVSRRASFLMEELKSRPEDISVIDAIIFILELAERFPLDLDLWKAQNTYYRLGRGWVEKMEEESKSGSETAAAWLTRFYHLGHLLRVNIST